MKQAMVFQEQDIFRPVATLDREPVHKLLTFRATNLGVCEWCGDGVVMLYVSNDGALCKTCLN